MFVCRVNKLVSFELELLLSIGSKVSIMLRDVAIYLGSSIVNRAIPFLILPILVRVLNADEYGIMVIFQAACSFAIPLIGLCLSVNISKFIYRKTGSDMPMAINLVVMTSLINVSLVIIVDQFIDLRSISEVLDYKMVPVIAIVGAAASILQALQIIFRSINQPKMFAVIEIGVTLLAYVPACMLIIILKRGWEIFAYCFCISNVAFCVIAWVSANKHGLKLSFMRPDYSLLKEMLWISLPFVPNLIGTMGLSYFDRFIVGYYAGNSEVAIYSVGALLGMSVILVTESVNKAWTPWVFKNLAKETEQAKVAVAHGCIAFAILILIIPVAVFFLAEPAIYYLFPPEYHRASEITFLVSIAATIQGIYFIFFPFFVQAGKTYYLSIITIFSGITSVAVGYWLVPLHGGVGAAYAKVVGFLVMGVGIIVISRKVYPMPWGNLSLSYFNNNIIRKLIKN